MYDRNRSWIIILLGFLWIYKTLQHYTCIIFISLCYLLESRMFGFLNDCHINQSMNVINYKNTLKCIVYGPVMDRKLSINFARSCMNGMFSVTQALVWKKHQLNCLHNWPYFFFIHKKGLLCFINVNDFFFHISCGYLRMARDSYFKGRITYTLESFDIVHVGPMFMAFCG